jgi:hypothetical protein
VAAASGKKNAEHDQGDIEEQKVEALVGAATERGYTVEQGAKNLRRSWESHWIVRTREGALYGDTDSLLQRLEGERERVHITTKENRMSQSSGSPQSKRGSSQNYEQFSKGEVNIGINAIRKDGGPENEGASKLFDKGGDVKQPGSVRDN